MDCEQIKFAQVDLGGDTMVRVLKSIGMNLNTELEGSFYVYGNTPVIIALCKEGDNLEKFCLSESITITKNMSRVDFVARLIALNG